MEQNPRFSAFRFDINGQHSVLVTAPGEPLSDLGFQIRNDTKDLGFDHLILAG